MRMGQDPKMVKSSIIIMQFDNVIPVNIHVTGLKIRLFVKSEVSKPKLGNCVDIFKVVSFRSHVCFHRVRDTCHDKFTFYTLIFPTSEILMYSITDTIPPLGDCGKLGIYFPVAHISAYVLSFCVVCFHISTAAYSSASAGLPVWAQGQCNHYHCNYYIIIIIIYYN